MVRSMYIFFLNAFCFLFFQLVNSPVFVCILNTSLAFLWGPCGAEVHGYSNKTQVRSSHLHCSSAITCLDRVYIPLHVKLFY